MIPEKPKAFPLFVRLWGSKTEEDAAEGLPEENHEGGFRLSLGTVSVFKAQTFWKLSQLRTEVRQLSQLSPGVWHF